MNKTTDSKTVEDFFLIKPELSDYTEIKTKY